MTTDNQTHEPKPSNKALLIVTLALALFWSWVIYKISQWVGENPHLNH